MFDRRRLLITASATAAVSAEATDALARGGGRMGASHFGHARQAKPKPMPAPGSDPATAAQLNAVLDKIFQEELKESPQSLTGLGLDKGDNAWAASRLDDASQAQVDRGVMLSKRWLGELQAVNRKKLAGMDAVNFDTVQYQGVVSLQGAERFKYGASGYPAPYVLSQLTGAYQSIPDFLDSQHVIETKAGAEAYLSRLAQFATVLDQETERAKVDAAAGVIPPDFVIDTTLKQLKSLRGTATEKTTLVESVVRRTKEKGIAGDWGARAATIVNGPVWAAIDRQIALMEGWRAKAVHDAGVWRLPDGAAYYRFGTKFHTTTNMTPDEIHKLGLDMVASLSAEADALFKSQGMSQGTVGQRMAALFKDPRFIYPNTEEGKAKLLAYLNGLVKIVSAELPKYFGTLPKAGLDIRRVPVAIEAGAPGGYYNSGTLDGSRPGAYYINLRDTAEVPRWTLPTLTYHEGIPGHHLQGTLVLEAQGIPMIRKVLGFNAYIEGWALYSEQLADEIGMYREDPFGRLGYLHDAIFRGVRLVVDSGMHAKRWSREQAVKYYVETIGDPETVAITEIERYCVWPGQACSYMVGKVSLLRLRAAARAKLGKAFDIRRFHDAVLLTGAMPLEVLEHRLDDWVAAGGI